VSAAATSASASHGPALTAHTLRPAEILRFHAPVAATILSYAIVFNILNSAMARTAQAAAALAAFAVAQGLIDLVASPAGMGNQWIVARGRDRASLKVGVRVMAQMVATVTILIALIGWTPVGRFVYFDFFGAPEHLFDSINGAVRACVLMPVLWALRNAGQAILMLRRQTQLMTAGVLVRLAWVWTASTWLLRVPAIGGAVMGGILWISGMGVEATFLVLAARRHIRALPAAPDADSLPATPGRIWRFLLPLMASAILWALGKPLIIAAMARTADPETSIAAYQVAWHAAFLLLSVQADFRQAVVVFWNDAASLKALTRFGYWLGAVISLVMLGLGVSGGAQWFLRVVLGTPSSLAAVGGRLFLILGLLPLLWIISEIYVGRLLRNGTTAAIGSAKVVNMAVMIATVFGLTFAAPGLGPLTGAIALVAGHSAELLTLRQITRQLSPVPTPR